MSKQQESDQLEDYEKKKGKKKEKTKKIKRDLKIYPIKIDEDKLNEGETNYPLSNPVHLLCAIGRVKAGKSLLLNNLYLSDRFYGNDYTVKILISSTAYNDAINKYLIQDCDFVFTEYSDALLDEILDIIKNDDTNGRYLIIFDDVIGSNLNQKRTGKLDSLTKLITMYRHIANKNGNEGCLAIALAVQYFKYLSPIARNNASCYYIMGHFPDAEIKKMSEALSIFGRTDKKFMEIYKASKKDKFDFLYLSVEHMAAFRNHDELLWSADDALKEGNDAEIKAKSIDD